MAPRLLLECQRLFTNMRQAPKAQLGAIALLTAIMAPTALSEQYQVDVVRLDHYTGYGGEFTVRDDPGGGFFDLSSYDPRTTGIGGVLGFQSFCMETTQYTGYNVQSIIADDGRVIGGGFGGSSFPGGDPISAGTAWLYSQFASGALTGYNFDDIGGTRSADAGTLQNALWWLENEDPAYHGIDNLGDAAANEFLDLLVSEAGFASIADAQSTDAAVGENGVWVINHIRTTSNGVVDHQSHLYYNTGRVNVPDGGTTVMLLGLALGGLGVTRRLLRGR